MKKLRILVADDEALIRLGLKAMLAEMGHEALLAANGREALDIARTAKPDLAILDIRMPLTDGLQAARTIAKSYPMPVLLLTAYSEQDLIDKAAELPIQSYLIKPVDERDLRAAISLAVARFNDALNAVQKVAELQETLETRKLLDRAKGILMQRGLTEDEAYHTLQKQARDRRISIRQAAEAVLAESEK
ncbi:MAG: ANTAR domain-containing response regulator [Anaerolineales bacterium]